jgi:hypothetical protein
MFEKLPQSLSKLTLAAAAIVSPANAWAQQQEGGAQDKGKSTASSPTDLPTAPGALAELKAPERPRDQIAIPERIAKAAESKGIPLDAVELKGVQWVGCVGDLCISLGKATTEELEATLKTASITGLRPGQKVYISGYQFPDHVVDPKNGLSYTLDGVGLFALQPDGSVTFIPDPKSKAIVSVTPLADTKPAEQSAIESRSAVELIEGNYSKEFRAKIEEMIEKELGTTFIIDFSVPSECKPCRDLRKVLDTLKGQLDPQRKLKIIVVNSPSFAAAARDTGYSVVPTISIIPKLPAATIEAANLGEESPTGETYRRFVGRSRRVGHVLKGVPSAKKLQAMADRAEARVEQGIDSPWNGLKPAADDVLNAGR